MRNENQQLLNAVEHPQVYEEAVIDSGGVPIVLSIWRAPAVAPSVVFLPGTMTHPLFYADFLDGLNCAGFNVVGVHYQGHGKSPRVQRVFTMSNLLRNAADAVNYARKRFGEPVVVMGSSQGSLLTMALAASGLPPDAVFAHNIFDPTTEESLQIIRFPAWLKPYRSFLDRLISLLAGLMPGLPVPYWVYLDPNRITRNIAIQDHLYADPLGLRSYPLAFVSSLISYGLSGLYDGRIRCPVVVLASAGDPLFALAHIQQLYQRIQAPTKELVVFELDAHLVLNECVNEVLPAVVEKLRHYTLTRPPQEAEPWKPL